MGLLDSVLGQMLGGAAQQGGQAGGGLADALGGLLGSDGLAEDEALWISPCKGIHTIGMTFPIDAVFLDGGRRVVAVRERVVPWRATRFIKGASSVLELAAGSIERTGIAVGNQIEFVDGEES